MDAAGGQPLPDEPAEATISRTSGSVGAASWGASAWPRAPAWVSLGDAQAASLVAAEGAPAYVAHPLYTDFPPFGGVAFGGASSSRALGVAAPASSFAPPPRQRSFDAGGCDEAWDVPLPCWALGARLAAPTAEVAGFADRCGSGADGGTLRGDTSSRAAPPPVRGRVAAATLERVVAVAPLMGLEAPALGREGSGGFEAVVPPPSPSHPSGVDEEGHLNWWEPNVVRGHVVADETRYSGGGASSRRSRLDYMGEGADCVEAQLLSHTIAPLSSSSRSRAASAPRRVEGLLPRRAGGEAPGERDGADARQDAAAGRQGRDDADVAAGARQRAVGERGRGRSAGRGRGADVLGAAAPLPVGPVCVPVLGAPAHHGDAASDPRGARAGGAAALSSSSASAASPAPSGPAQMRARPIGLLPRIGGVDSGDAAVPDDDRETSARTTLMISQIPKSYTRDMLCALLDERGLRGHYDFLYLPIKFATGVSFGYAFVNFISAEAAQRCHAELEGFRAWIDDSCEVCRMTSDTKYQGRQQCVEKYRNSPVMHMSVDDSMKPIVLENGVRVSFPEPSKRVKNPRYVRAPPAEERGDGDRRTP